MTRLSDTTSFDADIYEAEVIGLATELAHHDSGAHSHARGQLLYTRQGCIRITLENTECLLPPSRAAWIPPHTRHRAQMRNSVDYRSLWFRPDIAARLPADIRVIEVSSLLAAVLEPMALAEFDQTWSQGRHAHLLGLCLDEILQARQESMLLPMPKDRRLERLVASIEQVPPELHVLERQVGASAKTITRVFRKETGMSYQQWRQQWRVMRAIELLVTGSSISDTAAELAFSSDGVFIAFFRQMLGTTPGAYLSKAA